MGRPENRWGSCFDSTPYVSNTGFSCHCLSGAAVLLATNNEPPVCIYSCVYVKCVSASLSFVHQLRFIFHEALFCLASATINGHSLLHCVSNGSQPVRVIELKVIKWWLWLPQSLECRKGYITFYQLVSEWLHFTLGLAVLLLIFSLIGKCYVQAGIVSMY